jgi:hypothetical protein
MLLSPSTTGTVAIRTCGEVFLRRFAQRIEKGLLEGSSRTRNCYVATRTGPGVLQFRATTWLTAFNVGLNDVSLTLTPGGAVSYRILYAWWAGSAIALCACFAAIFIAFLLLFDLRTYIAENPGPEYLGLSPDQNVVNAWSMALFWGFVWPWILIALHKPHIRGLMNRMIVEVDSAD